MFKNIQHANLRIVGQDGVVKSVNPVSLPVRMFQLQSR